MSHRFFNVRHLAAIAASLSLGSAAHAAQVNLTITAENLAPTNSISFAPLHFGIHNGSFDAFNIGQVATAPIISVAEGGGGMAWLCAALPALFRWNSANAAGSRTLTKS